MHRLFCDAPLVQGQAAVVNADDLHHVKNVLRMKQGEVLALVDTTGATATGTIDTNNGFSILCGEVTPSGVTEAGGKITLYMGLAKGDKFDFVVQKAVELGAVRIVPVAFARSVVKITAKDEEKKCIRWNKIAREAAMQSGRLFLPEVTHPMTVSQVCEDMADKQVLVAYELEQHRSIADGLSLIPMDAELGLIVGPEGGIEQREVDQFCQAGATSISLGTRILRCETAPIALLSVAQFVRGGMGAPQKEGEKD